MEEADMMAASSQPMSSQTSSRSKQIRASQDSVFEARKPRKKKQKEGDIVKAVKNSAWGRQSDSAVPSGPRKGSSPKKQLMEVVMTASPTSQRVMSSQDKAPWLSRPTSSFGYHPPVASSAESSKQARERSTLPSSTRPLGLSKKGVAVQNGPNSSIPPSTSCVGTIRRPITVDKLHGRKRTVSSDSNSDSDELNMGRKSNRTTAPNKRQKTPKKKSPSQASLNVFSDTDSDVQPIGKDRTGRAIGKNVAHTVGRQDRPASKAPSKRSTNAPKTNSGKARTRIDSSPESDEAASQTSASEPPIKIKPRITEDWFAEIERKRKDGLQLDKGKETASNQLEIIDFSSSQPRSPVKLSEAADALLSKGNTGQSGARQQFSGLSEVDAGYCESILALDSLCPYCSEPLPAKPSLALYSLQKRLSDISVPAPTNNNPSARSAPWDQTIGFCTLHKAESTVIPLGLRDGYPDEIDFDAIPSRVDGTHMWRAIIMLCAEPDERSTWFRTTKRRIEQQGKRTWQSLAQQSRQKRMDLIQPGYYGDAGKLVLTRHFQRRFQVGDLVSLTKIPPGRTEPVIHPLNPDEFIINILVPEAATFLVMEDHGWLGKPFTKQTEGYDAARDRAFATVRSSIEFGRALYREEAAQVPQSLLGDARRRQTQSAASYPVYQPSPGTPVRRKQVVVDLSSLASPALTQRQIHASIMMDSSPIEMYSQTIQVPCSSSPPRMDTHHHRSGPPPSSSPAQAIELGDFHDSDEDVDMYGHSEAGTGNDTAVSDSDVEHLGSQLRTKGSVHLHVQDDEHVDDHYQGYVVAASSPVAQAISRKKPAESGPVATPAKDAARLQHNPLTRPTVRRLGLTPQRRL